MHRLHVLADRARSADSFEALCTCFGGFIEPLGFYAFTLGSAPVRKGIIDTSAAVLHSTLPEPFQNAYRSQRLEQLDPVFEILASRFTPITKSSLDSTWDAAPHKSVAKELAAEHDIGDALMIPINTLDFARGAVLLTKMPPREFERCVQRDGPLLHLASFLVMERAVEFGFGAVADPDVCLTNRERDCLELTAQGKTYEQIAGMMGITERTVRFHLSNTYKKLDAKSSSQAVTRAVKLGLIHA